MYQLDPFSASNEIEQSGLSTAFMRWNPMSINIMVARNPVTIIMMTIIVVVMMIVIPVIIGKTRQSCDQETESADKTT